MKIVNLRRMMKNVSRIENIKIKILERGEILRSGFHFFYHLLNIPWKYNALTLQLTKTLRSCIKLYV